MLLPRGAPYDCAVQVSLACPFCYSNIVTVSSVGRAVLLLWLLSSLMAALLLLPPAPPAPAPACPPAPPALPCLLLGLQSALLILACSCHLYVCKVAHRHTKVSFHLDPRENKTRELVLPDLLALTFNL
jgi:hypothetical protein